MLAGPHPAPLRVAAALVVEADPPGERAAHREPPEVAKKTATNPPASRQELGRCRSAPEAGWRCASEQANPKNPRPIRPPESPCPRARCFFGRAYCWCCNAAYCYGAGRPIFQANSRSRPPRPPNLSPLGPGAAPGRVAAKNRERAASRSSQRWPDWPGIPAMSRSTTDRGALCARAPARRERPHPEPAQPGLRTAGHLGPWKPVLGCSDLRPSTPPRHET